MFKANIVDLVVPETLYGLIQAVNPDLTLAFDVIALETPLMATQAQATAHGRNSTVTLSASGYTDTVTIYYDRVPIANSFPLPLAEVTNFTSVAVPQAAYTTAQDFISALNTAYGFNLTAGDVEASELQQYWAGSPNGSSYQTLAYQLLTWSATDLGYTSPLWVGYGPTTPVALATAFPSSYFAPAGLQTGDAAACLVQYSNEMLSQSQESFGAYLNRANTIYSGLTILDSDTSTANGGAEVSAIVTYGANQIYTAEYALNFPYAHSSYPFYSGSQIVYYTRYNVASNASQILGGVNGNFFVGDGIPPVIPLGAALGTTVVTSADLITFLNNHAYFQYMDTTDIVVETLPAYGEGGTVTYNLTFTGSYFVTDGVLPLTLSNTGPDYSASIPSTADLRTVTPLSDNVFAWLGAGNFNPNATIADVALSQIRNNIQYVPDDRDNWIGGLTAAIVADTTADTGLGDGSFVTTIEVTTPWGATYQQIVTYIPQSLATALLYNGSPYAVDGVATFYTDSVSFAQPMRVVDWLASVSIYTESSPGNTMSGGEGAILYGPMLPTFIYGEFANLTDMTFVGEDGNISFTLTAPLGSTLQSGSVQIVIVMDSLLAELETSVGPATGSPTPN